MNDFQTDYIFNSISDRRLCSWAWSKSRQTEISSIACFRYALPIFFTYLRNDTLSKLGLGPGVRVVCEEDIELDDVEQINRRDASDYPEPR